MSKYSTAFGIDNHARTTTICAIIERTGETETRVFPGNDYNEMAEWMLAFPQPHYAVYESGCTGFMPLRSLRALGINIDVIAVSKLARSTDDKKKKNDRVDALRLAKAILSYDTTPVYVPDEVCEGLRDLSRALCDLKKKSRTAKQHLTSFLLRQGYVWSERAKSGKLKKRWGREHWAWINRISFDEPSADIVFETYINEVKESADRYDALLRETMRQASSPRFKPVMDAVRSIKGCGFLAALAFVSEVDDFSRFKNGRSVSAYFGVVPKENSSGEKTQSGSITKSGNSLVRRLFIEGSWSYVRTSRAEKKLEEGVVVSEAIRKHAKTGSERLRRRRAALAKTALHACKANCAIASELIRWAWVLGLMAQDEQRQHQPA